MSCTLYIYYRVQPAHASALAARLTPMLRELHALTGVQGRLLSRCDDPLTWMEVYEGVTDRAGFEAALGARVARHGLEAMTEGGRRTECFREWGAGRGGEYTDTGSR